MREEVKKRERKKKKERENKKMINKEIEEVFEKIRRTANRPEVEYKKKALRKIVVEFDEEERENCHTEIIFWKKLALYFREITELSAFIKIRIRELENEFQLSEEEELVRFWIAEILFDLNIIDELSSDIATEWLLESQECEIKLVRWCKKKWLEV